MFVSIDSTTHTHRHTHTQPEQEIKETQKKITDNKQEKVKQNKGRHGVIQSKIQFEIFY